MARNDPTATFQQQPLPSSGSDPDRTPAAEPSSPSRADTQLDESTPGGVLLGSDTGITSSLLSHDVRYRTEDVLGKGGMGRVLLAHDQVVGRRVALKQLQPDRVADSGSRARFGREAKLQGQLEHPAIVPVYDIGTDGEGNPFFTMRRVRGQPLDQILQTMAIGQPTKFTRHKLLTAFAQLCLAVHYAHERGVVHRDIKPSNIMLGSYGEIYLLDWGIAKVADEQTSSPRPSFADELDTPAGPHTGRGAVMGSLVTMAPEQALGAEVDARSDVYALGAVLFEILTFEPFHPMGAFAEVVKKVVYGVEPRPSVRVPEADVPPELEEIVVRATKLHPDDRFPTALAMQERLEAYLEGDRDQQLRREGARKHAEAAKAAADEALGRVEGGRGGDAPAAPEETARERALREVGRALALDPQNELALGTFVALLTSPPKELPREVRDEELAHLRRRQRIAGIAAACLYGYISVNALFTWQLGVRDVPTFTNCHIGWAIAFVLSIVSAVRPSYKVLFAVLVTGLTTSVYVTNVYGPFLIVPTLLGVHAAIFALVRDWWLRILGMALTSIGWTLSVFGERGGLFPKVLSYADGNLAMSSPVVVLPEGATTFFMYSAVLTSILAPALVIGALRSSSAKIELAARLQAWQLRRLAGDAARTTSGAFETKKKD